MIGLQGPRLNRERNAENSQELQRPLFQGSGRPV
jgi:hypothetical protein